MEKTGIRRARSSRASKENVCACEGKLKPYLHTFTMADSTPPEVERRIRIPREGRQDGRRRCFGVFLRRKKRQDAPPQVDSTPATQSARLQEVSLQSQASSYTQRVTDSPSITPSSSQRRTMSEEVPSLVSEKEAEERKQLTGDGGEASIESLQMDLDFVLKQHAIMDQIMVDESKSQDYQNSKDRSMASNPSNRSTSRFADFHDYQTSSNHAAMALDDDDQEYSDDFLHFLNDPAILEEQRRIMDNIVSSSPHSLSGHAEPPLHQLEPPSSRYASSTDQGSSSLSSSARSSSTRHVNDEIMGYIEEAATCISVPSTRREDKMIQLVRSSSEPYPHTDSPSMSPSPRRAKSAPLIVVGRGTDSPTNMKNNPYTTQCEQDAHVEVYQGKRVQVRGTNHTWKSIAKGKATLVQCPVCSTILQVGSQAKLLFCTKCNEVSPVSRHINSSMDYRADGLIAVVVQQQEVDVAFAMKMARNTPKK